MPSVAVRTDPNASVPVIVGATVLTGLAFTTEVGTEVADALCRSTP